MFCHNAKCRSAERAMERNNAATTVCGGVVASMEALAYRAPCAARMVAQRGENIVFGCAFADPISTPDLTK